MMLISAKNIIELMREMEPMYLLIYAVAHVELGKTAKDIKQVEHGLEFIKVSYTNLKKQNADKKFIEEAKRKYFLSRKILYLMKLQLEEERDQYYLKDLKSKFSQLGKLYVLMRVNKKDQHVTKKLFERAALNLQNQKASVIERRGKQKTLWINLKVPDHLTCPLTGEIMVDPVMMTSGQTYERENILQYLEYKKLELKQRIAENDDEFDRNRFFTCPVSQQVIDPKRLINNRRIKQACSDFRRDNPWAFEFDPREEYHQIKVWTNPEQSSETPGGYP